MNTVTFDEKNSYTDFGLILSEKTIGEAEPRFNYIDVPARDGHLDLTEAFGEVKYKSRPLTFYLQYIGPEKEWPAAMSALSNYLNGKKRKIYFEENYYWHGRCVVGAVASKKGIREVEIECDCEPYKLKIQSTVVEVEASGAAVVKTIMNDRKTVTPHIAVISGTPTLKWTDKVTGGTFSVALAGNFDNKILDFKFYEGANTFTVEGTGKVRLTYQEGSL